MRVRSAHSFVTFAALLPLLVVAVSGQGYDRMRCMFSGQVSELSEGGCCPAEDAPAMPVASGASCCAHESARTVKLPAEAAAPRLTAAPVIAVLPELGSLPARVAPSSAPRAISQAPPPIPLVLVKQSFLI
jgi:hypothetical protein